MKLLKTSEKVLTNIDLLCYTNKAVIKKKGTGKADLLLYWAVAKR